MGHANAAGQVGLLGHLEDLDVHDATFACADMTTARGPVRERGREGGWLSSARDWGDWKVTPRG